jgi:hypothetical protein
VRSVFKEIMNLSFYPTNNLKIGHLFARQQLSTVFAILIGHQKDLNLIG